MKGANRAKMGGGGAETGNVEECSWEWCLRPVRAAAG